jgi:hypothetical protein
METKNREKLLLIATGTVVVLWLLSILVFSPLIDSWHSRSAEIAKLKQEISDGTMLVRRDSTIRDRWDSMRANALASNPTVAERQLFTAFDHWVSSGRVTEGSFRPQVQEGDTNFSTVDCRSDVSGTLLTVRDFLKAMSKDPQADKVESFELTSKDDNGLQLTLALSLSGLILTDSDPSSVPPVPVVAAPAQTTNLAAVSESDPFQIIGRNNIFNQSRRPEEPSGPRRPVAKVEAITFCGAAMENGVGSAWFDGSGVQASRSYKNGDSIGDGDLKIAKIINLVTVMITNSTSNTFTLSTEGNASLRREGSAPWRVSGYIAVATPESSSTEPASSVLAAGAKTSASSMDEFLRKRRLEQEAK